MKTKLSILVCLISLIMGCTEELFDHNDNGKISIYGEGDIVERTFNFDKVSEIENTGVANIVINYGETRSFVLKAQQNIMDIMTVTNSGSKILKISTDQRYNIRNSKDVTLEITTPDAIDKISVTGVGNITYSNGHAGSVSYNITGVGNINFNNFTVDTCYLTVSGVSNSNLTVSKLLSINISGVCNVHYKGDPTLEKHLSGVATVTKEN
jgi:hypothetical protein